MQGSGGLILSMPTPIEHRTASQTERKPGPTRGRNLLIPPPSSHVAFCVWPICPATRSTGLAGMKQSFGARPARSCLLSMHWIVANHKRKAAVSVSQPARPAGRRTRRLLSCRTHPSTRSTQSSAGTGERSEYIVVDENWVISSKPRGQPLGIRQRVIVFGFGHSY